MCGHFRRRVHRHLKSRLWTSQAGTRSDGQIGVVLELTRRLSAQPRSTTAAGSNGGFAQWDDRYVT